MKANGRKFNVKLRAEPDYTLVRLSGIIDEDNGLAALRSKLEGNLLILDLSGVLRINSCGVRDWVNWLEAIEHGNRDVIMTRCSSAIVAQLNMVTNFAGKAIVSSVYAPYYCDACDAAVDKLLEIANLPQPVVPPAFECPECGEPLVFDDFEESYFAFIDPAQAANLDGDTRRILAELSPDVERKLRDLNEGVLTPVGEELHTPSLSTNSKSFVRAQPTRPPTPAAPEPSPAKIAPTSPTADAVTDAADGTPAWIVYALIVVALVVIAILAVLVFTLT